MRWQVGSKIVDFLDNLIAPFLAWQTYYEAFRKPPPWGERPHYGPGILEFYAELLNRSVDSSIEGFMRLLARKNQPKGHELCPCNSEERLRNCHKDLLYKTRQKVAWQDVKQDLDIFLRVNNTK